ncbi:hypothetical protein RFI_19720 [Reticulomyxa filosa]|uniref:Uncharacterized protein n=1 Tax=Reticulomyxa filosa TaxID=46433 RepID=X6MWY5_RETFI|nr:hypothetical protein RFI_19720 [Reticulomyxa filosa]|eukprot:ETO17600.1 hypothetical protein RFI_19720 [Reticulomyxa filosa]
MQGIQGPAKTNDNHSDYRVIQKQFEKTKQKLESLSLENKTLKATVMVLQEQIPSLQLKIQQHQSETMESQKSKEQLTVELKSERKLNQQLEHICEDMNTEKKQLMQNIQELQQQFNAFMQRQCSKLALHASSKTTVATQISRQCSQSDLLQSNTTTTVAFQTTQPNNKNAINSDIPRTSFVFCAGKTSHRPKTCKSDYEKENNQFLAKDDKQLLINLHALLQRFPLINGNEEEARFDSTHNAYTTDLLNNDEWNQPAQRFEETEATYLNTFPRNLQNGEHKQHEKCNNNRTMKTRKHKILSKKYLNEETENGPHLKRKNKRQVVNTGNPTTKKRGLPSMMSATDGTVLRKAKYGHKKTDSKRNGKIWFLCLFAFFFCVRKYQLYVGTQ